jgi:hypothetical protein
MNLPIAPITPAFSAHMILETLADGQVVAWVAELPDCRVVAESRESAIAALEPLVNERMMKVEVRPFSITVPTEHPIAKFIGMFKDDPDFAEIVAEMRAERELDDNNPAYT